MYLRVRDRVSDEDVISAALWSILMRKGLVKLISCTLRSSVVTFFKCGYREMKQRLYTGLFSNSNGVYLVIACLSWKQHATVNYVRPMGYNM